MRTESDLERKISRFPLHIPWKKSRTPILIPSSQDDPLVVLIEARVVVVDVAGGRLAEGSGETGWALAGSQERSSLVLAHNLQFRFIRF